MKMIWKAEEKSAAGMGLDFGQLRIQILLKTIWKIGVFNFL